MAHKYARKQRKKLEAEPEDKETFFTEDVGNIGKPKDFLKQMDQENKNRTLDSYHRNMNHRNVPPLRRQPTECQATNVGLECKAMVIPNKDGTCPVCGGKVFGEEVNAIVV